LDQFNKGYKNFFNAEGGKRTEIGEEGNEGDSFSKNWGWWSLLDSITNSRPDKWKYFLDMEVIEAMNICCFYKDKQRMITEEHKRQMQKIKR